MKRILLFLAILLAAPPAFAQIIPPNQFINAVSSGITVCTSGNCATWAVPNSAPSLTAQITGTMTSMTVTFEGTADGQTWFSVTATNLSSGANGTTATATGQYAIVNPGLVGFRVRCTTYSSGAINVTLTRGSASAKAGIGGGGGVTLSGNAYDWVVGNGTSTQSMVRGTITTSSPWNFTQTWNAGAVTFVGLDINNTVTAAANGSTYLKAENAGGDVFGIYKDSALTTETNQVSIGVNQGLSGTSENFAFRGLQGSVGLTSSATAAPGVTRLLIASGISANTDTSTAATVRLVRTEGVKVNSTLPVCWTSTASAQDACDTSLNRTSAGVLEVNNGTPGTLAAYKGAYQVVTLKDSNTAPTIASGGCTSPAVTHSNGTAAFLLTIGSSCTGVKSLTLTMPAASHFWACDANNNTSDAQQAANTIASRATSTTAVVLTNYARTTGLTADFTASDTLLVKCSGE